VVSAASVPEAPALAPGLAMAVMEESLSLLAAARREDAASRAGESGAPCPRRRP